jgi:hypothetical protein
MERQDMQIAQAASAALLEAIGYPATRGRELRARLQRFMRAEEFIIPSAEPTVCPDRLADFVDQGENTSQRARHGIDSIVSYRNIRIAVAGIL